MLEKLIGGRLNRKKYIMYYLAVVVTSVFLMMAFSALMLATGQLDYAEGGTMYMVGVVIGLFANLATAVLGIRRLHDLGKGGKWVLAVLVPSVLSFCVYFFDNNILTNLVSALDIAVIMALAVMKGNDGANEFGPAN